MKCTRIPKCAWPFPRLGLRFYRVGLVAWLGVILPILARADVRITRLIQVDDIALDGNEVDVELSTAWTRDGQQGWDDVHQYLVIYSLEKSERGTIRAERIIDLARFAEAGPFGSAREMLGVVRLLKAPAPVLNLKRDKILYDIKSREGQPIRRLLPSAKFISSTSGRWLMFADSTRRVHDCLSDAERTLADPAMLLAGLTRMGAEQFSHFSFVDDLDYVYGDGLIFPLPTGAVKRYKSELRHVNRGVEFSTGFDGMSRAPDKSLRLLYTGVAVVDGSLESLAVVTDEQMHALHECHLPYTESGYVSWDCQHSSRVLFRSNTPLFDLKTSFAIHVWDFAHGPSQRYELSFSGLFTETDRGFQLLVPDAGKSLLIRQH